MTIRERVLQSWKKYKDQVLALKKGINTLGQKTEFLPCITTDLNRCRNELESWTSYEYQEKLAKVKTEISELEVPELVADLWFSSLNSFDMFKTLTEGWKKEKDSYARFRNSNEGPTIEEVDDW